MILLIRWIRYIGSLPKTVHRFSPVVGRCRKRWGRVQMVSEIVKLKHNLCTVTKNKTKRTSYPALNTKYSRLTSIVTGQVRKERIDVTAAATTNEERLNFPSNFLRTA